MSRHLLHLLLLWLLWSLLITLRHRAGFNLFQPGADDPWLYLPHLLAPWLLLLGMAGTEERSMAGRPPLTRLLPLEARNWVRLLLLLLPVVALERGLWRLVDLALTWLADSRIPPALDGAAALGWGVFLTFLLSLRLLLILSRRLQRGALRGWVQPALLLIPGLPILLGLESLLVALQGPEQREALLMAMVRPDVALSTLVSRATGSLLFSAAPLTGWAEADRVLAALLLALAQGVALRDRLGPSPARSF